jgi:hypothetical protein
MEKEKGRLVEGKESASTKGKERRSNGQGEKEHTPKCAIAERREKKREREI